MQLPSMQLPSQRPNLIVVGNGMVGHRFLQAAHQHGLCSAYRVITFAEEPRVAYDRVNLSTFFQGKTEQELSLVAPNEYQSAGIEVVLGDPVLALDLDRKRVSTSSGRELEYDQLVLATGSRPFVPEIPGNQLPGCFVYRTVDDLMAIRAAAKGCRRGAVIGGGLLGLEAANALLSLGLETHVVEFAPRLMPLQVDEGGGALL
ncbi:MAG TPA: FAD-dependent oxidoreductase, partial [Polyangiaceae bacterium]